VIEHFENFPLSALRPVENVEILLSVPA